MPDDVKPRIAPGNRKYAVPRSDYIHPLYGLHGEVLTDDWVPDHPHHRGIYWAWPEVDWQGGAPVRGRPARLAGGLCPADRQDRIVARGRLRTDRGRERVALRRRPGDRPRDRHPPRMAADRRGPGDRPGVPLRRPGDRRANRPPRPVALRRPEHPPLARGRSEDHAVHRSARGHAPHRLGPSQRHARDGRWPTALTILQSPANPDYPGDWVQYPEISWIQPTFPASGTRYTLRKDRPLVLRYRLWIHDKPLAAEAIRKLATTPSSLPPGALP